ncbi:MAG: hypothetical protein ABIY55_25510 [Kofleriaceae bacterium]
MMKKMMSLVVITFSLVGFGVGCRSGAQIKTAHHAVGVGAGAR